MAKKTSSKPAGQTAGKSASKTGKKGRKGRPVRPPRQRSWGWIAAFVVLGIICVGGITYAALNQGAGSPSNIEIAGVQTYDDLTRKHTRGQVDYEQQPPVGGPHNPVWLGCMGTVYEQPVPNENAVHSLEHGAVWVTYQPDLPADQRQELADRVKGQPYTFMSPYPDQQSPIVLTAWGHQLKLDSASDDRIDDFFAKFVQGPQTPEPGASCVGGQMR